MDQPKAVPLSISPEIQRGVYVNHAQIVHDAVGCTLTFASYVTGDPTANAVARLHMSLEHARVLCDGLMNILAHYEQTCGKVRTFTGPVTPVLEAKTVN